ncbi:MAG TPA: flagellar hook-associated protein FlgL [Anaerolineae bacterium]|nr:flagellar hook-associated protein FlgL [Anaerolineae bacterium]
MRITNNLVLSRVLRDLEMSRRRLNDLQVQVSSGKRILKPEDDPVGTGKALGIRTALRVNESYLRTLEVSHDWLMVTEAALQTIGSALERAYVLALGASNDSWGEDERVLVAKEVEELLRQAVSAANTRHHDRFIFSGYQTRTEPFELDDLTLEVTYNGDGGQIEHEIEPGHMLVVNLPGNVEAFSKPFNALRDLLTDLRTPGATGDTIKDNIAKIEEARNALLEQTVTIGARAQAVEQIEERMRQLDIALQDQLSKVEDLDLAEGTMRMMNQEMAYQTLLQVAARLSQQTLIEFLR